MCLCWPMCRTKRVGISSDNNYCLHCILLINYIDKDVVDEFVADRETSVAEVRERAVATNGE